MFDYNIKTVLWIFTISTLVMYLKSRNPLHTLLLSYHIWVTSKFRVNFRFDRYWWYCLINFWNYHTTHVFEVRESNADISIDLPCLIYLKNLGQLSVQGYLEGTDDCISCGFSQFLRRICFLGQGIHNWHSERATMSEWPQKSKSTSGLKCTSDSVLWIFEMFTLFMFLRSGNPLLIFLYSYHG